MAEKTRQSKQCKTLGPCGPLFTYKWGLRRNSSDIGVGIWQKCRTFRLFCASFPKQLYRFVIILSTSVFLLLSWLLHLKDIHWNFSGSLGFDKLSGNVLGRVARFVPTLSRIPTLDQHQIHTNTNTNTNTNTPLSTPVGPSLDAYKYKRKYTPWDNIQNTNTGPIHTNTNSTLSRMSTLGHHKFKFPKFPDSVTLAQYQKSKTRNANRNMKTDIGEIKKVHACSTLPLPPPSDRLLPSSGPQSFHCPNLQVKVALPRLAEPAWLWESWGTK